RAQWDAFIWPAIRGCDLSAVVDLAAGHGRCSALLRRHARRIWVVDFLEENVAFCRHRFRGDDRFEFVHNDGCSLDGIPDGAASFVHSWDAMVHFDSDVVRAYLAEFRRVLRPGGRGFCHHSNHDRDPDGDPHDHPGWRSFMSRELFAHYGAKE